MNTYKKMLAAPYRTENLDLFPHPCATFLKGTFISDSRLCFDTGHETKNLLGSVDVLHITD